MFQVQMSQGDMATGQRVSADLMNKTGSGGQKDVSSQNQKVQMD